MLQDAKISTANSNLSYLPDFEISKNLTEIGKLFNIHCFKFSNYLDQILQRWPIM